MDEDPYFEVENTLGTGEENERTYTRTKD